MNSPRPGAIGTAVAQSHLRNVLGSILGLLVMGGEHYVTFKPGARLLFEQPEPAHRESRGSHRTG